jgi:hypothetical protein
MNSIQVIQPYRHAGTWVFDDERVGLVQEPFVAGIPQMIDKLVQDIPDATLSFRLLFSIMLFPDYSVLLKWLREEVEGDWYRAIEYSIAEQSAEGWLCPALFKYFDEAPDKLYIKAEGL